MPVSDTERESTNEMDLGQVSELHVKDPRLPWVWSGMTLLEIIILKKKVEVPSQVCVVYGE